MKLLLILFAVFFTRVCFAQVEGIVSDAADNERLPFTHVVNLTTAQGAFTDINGFYRIEARQGDVLQFTYVGYLRQNITAGSASQINVRLAPDGYAISELVVLPGVNPAHRIIENAIANRVRNNPDNRNAYSCMIYNRLVLEGDTAMYLFINESVIRHEYKYYGNVSEHIISSRTSGAEIYQTMAFFQPMLQFFHFYDDVLEWKFPVKFLVNPISPGSTSRYFFHLRDTIISGVDSTFIISFQPRRTANFDGLKGLLYINSNHWAIQNVVAEPADYSPTRLKLQQSYEFMDGVWFPSELSLELFFGSVNVNGEKGAVLRGRSHITEINLNSDLSNIRIRSRNITMADNAHRRLELIESYRDIRPTAREDSTYRFWSGIIVENSPVFDHVFRFMEDYMDNEGALPIKKFVFPLEKIVQQNYYEGFRVGLAAYTNRRLSPLFSVGGYYGYGIDDRQSKFGASVSVFPEKHLDSEIKIWWENDLKNLSWSNEIGFSARKLFGKFDLMTGFVMQELQTVFDYSYKEQDMSHGWRSNAEARITLRYAHREDRVKMFRRTHSVFTTQPVIHLNLFIGLPNVFGSAYRYIKTEIGAERSRYVRNLGTVTYALWGGWMNNTAPMPLTFAITDTERSLFHRRIPQDSRKSFNALTGDAYAANQYINAFLYHDFGTLLHKTQSKVFRPRIAVAQSFGWSKLNRTEQHISSEINILDMQKGYFESGFIIEDIIRLEVVKMFFFGIGGGVYGAYGGSVQQQFLKTLTPKIRISASF